MQSNNKTTDTALYYRAAQKNDTLYLDNQMQQLLCYAKQQEPDTEMFNHNALLAYLKGGVRV